MKTEKQSWLFRLKNGLSKSASKLTSGLTDIFTKKKLDKDTKDQLEDLLIMADIGTGTAGFLVNELAKSKFDKEIDAQEIKESLSDLITEILTPYAKPIELDHKPQIILFCGVNGNGKTTTIGKLAKLYHDTGKSVMVAACDTFRAAAVEQLAIWANRAKAKLIMGPENSDPASVAYKAVDEAIKNNIDVLLIDTAGRLQNKTNLMHELQKITSVIKKLDQNAPHNIVMVIDATTGQNALSQIATFREMIGINGLVITKLDGSAKAGVVVAICDKYKLPIHFIGVGESIDDLNSFNAKNFSDNLVGM